MGGRGDSREQCLAKDAAGQQCGTEYPGAVPQSRRYHGGGEAGVEQEGQYRFAPGAIEALHIAHAATDDDDVRIENIDHVGEGLAEQQVQPVHGEPGDMIMGTGRSNLGERETAFGPGLVPGLQRRAADEGFDAAALAAVALWPLRQQDVVPPLPGDAVVTVEDLAVDDDTGPDPSAMMMPNTTFASG